MSHYFAQEMFSKVLVSPTLASPYNTLKVSIVSDHLEPLEAELMVKIQRWDELENHYEEFLTAQVQEQSVYSGNSEYGDCILKNIPLADEVTLRGQKPPLKCC